MIAILDSKMAAEYNLYAAAIFRYLSKEFMLF